MAVIDIVARIRARLLKLAGKPAIPFDFRGSELPASERDRLLSGAPHDLARLVYGHEGAIVHKWTHYLDIYERHFAKYRGTDFKMLEIGVFKGGSLEIWRKYFGEKATIFGIDIDPACAGYAKPPNQVRIGSQGDEAFLRSVIAEMGTPDVILDDGSHIAEHQAESFRVLFPLLKDGGLYVIEDMHTAYWPGYYQGGYRRHDSAMGLVKQMIDDMHGWYHTRSTPTPAKTQVTGIHVYDSVVVIEKGNKSAPEHIKVG